VKQCTNFVLKWRTAGECFDQVSVLWAWRCQ